MKFWPMPITANQVCGVGIANIYKEIQKLCKEPPKVFIEKIFTMPTDAVSQKDYDTARETMRKLRINNPGQTWSPEDFPELPPVRLDGRQGNLNYAKGAGLLEMCHMLGWSIMLISPKTWCGKLHIGNKDLPPKERSSLYVSQRWPHLYQEGSVIWPVRHKKPHEGLVDALMIAEYGRRFS